MITIERLGSGDLSWAVLVDDKVVVNGLTHTQALRERLSLRWSLPENASPAGDTRHDSSLRGAGPLGWSLSTFPGASLAHASLTQSSHF